MLEACSSASSGRLRQLHAAGLAAAADLDLRLDDDRVTDLLGSGLGVGSALDGLAECHRHVMLGEELLRLVLHQVHGSTAPLWVRRVARAPGLPRARSADLRPVEPHPPRRVRGVKRTESQVSPRVSPPVTLAVTEYGDRSSSTHVLMVHGFPDDQQMWEPVVGSLPEDWHVVTYDVRGVGRSTRPDGSRGLPHRAAGRGPDRGARRDRPRRGAGAPRRARLGFDRRLGGDRRRDVGPPPRGSAGVVHLQQRAVPGPHGQPHLVLARPAAAAAAGVAQLVRLAVPGPGAPRAGLAADRGCSAHCACWTRR